MPPISPSSDRASRRELLAALMTISAAPGLAAAGGAEAKRRKRRGGDGSVWDDTLADLHKRTFRYFWETTSADNGLAPDNWPNPDFCSIASIGFALNAYVIGVRSGYVSRGDAADRTLTTLRTLWNGPQGPDDTGVMGHKGFFYHFLHMDSGLRYEHVELSSIDTCLMLGGVLTAAAFFDGDNAAEAEIRKTGISLYERVDWTFMARENGLISMGWHPEKGLQDHDANGLINRNWDRYNEGMMVYLLAMASPTHPSPAEGWRSWMATIDGTWGPNFGEIHLGFAPLFGHQYSHIWYDFRGIADDYMRRHGSDYFTNSQKATRAQRNYAVINPGHFKAYGKDVWGLTACRGPGYIEATYDGHEQVFQGYSARGPQAGDGEGIDDGTIAPTAGVSSVAFTPDICVPLIHSLRTNYGADLYGQYGFYDAFNPSFPKDLPSRTGRATNSAGWVSSEYLGIDQGPILSMLENYRSGQIWDLFNRSPLTGQIARRGFERAGFEPVGPSGKWISA